jgi:hypothetical protein
MLLSRKFMPLLREQFEKQPSEEYPFDINFGTAIPLGATELISAVASAVKWPRRHPKQITDATTEILFSDTPILVGNICDGPKTRARILVINGLDQYDYKITVIGTFDNGAKLEEDIYFRVREK